MDLNRELAAAKWIKSTRSASNGGECVEVARLSSGRHAVRDSKNTTGPALIFTTPEWTAFINGIRNGDFD
ncbi:DUF397 domain-containing protein [Streptosporangium sp. NBC_01755]|uniref:DUF397 domain-containing protein n=1 Tax=unclassified Streptosporangium TaxID=2632669 RepID=UPI002DDAD9F2|nr:MULTISPECIES: DUF397 domain-containing protein [unclassified Streptosporangium]WSA27717.1 DUF397 domain-containing protein [Streptosporangium sp. NBC_01810]WSD00809.1 DUF397 domain-containing protein [Streptosporangium sp. NBC_01755]